MNDTAKVGLTQKSPKLPPMPRKGNRTIYLADDELWESAKTLAGKEGLSSVISRALVNFVTQRRVEDAACEKFHFEILDATQPDGPVVEVIGFEGRMISSRVFNLVFNPFDGSDENAAAAKKSGATNIETVVQIYRTKLGTLVLLAAPSFLGPESESAFYHYEKHNSVRELMSGSIASCMFPPDRNELLTELTKGLGKDAVTWID